MIRRLPAACVLLVLGTATATPADEIAAGRDLAERWCTGCHIVGPGIRGGTVGPEFEAVAARPDQSRAALSSWMVAPHPPMPDLNVTPQEASEIAAYIMSLRQ